MGSEGEEPLCSARGCRALATWAIVWNNPKIHAADREKIWAACDEHKHLLTDYLIVDPALVRELHTACIPHLLVRVRDGTGIGPMVVPGMTSCLDNYKK